MRDRLDIVDALRGFSLAGVALVHIIEQYIASAPTDGFTTIVPSLLDSIIGTFVGVFIIGKFFALFSILFGLSFFLQMHSSEQKTGTYFGYRFLWRSVLLFAFGYFHQLFYKGDILTIYALLCPFLIPFYKINKNWVLIVAGLCLLSVPRLLIYVIFGNEGLLEPNVMMDPTNSKNLAYIQTLKEGSLFDVFHANSTAGFIDKMNFQLGIFARFYATFGYFLIGLWLGKIGLFRQIENFIPFLKKTLKITALIIPIILILLAGIFYLAPKPVTFEHWMHILGLNVYDWFNSAMTIILICCFVFVYRKHFKKRLFIYLSAYGRMALTNYILQSIIGTAILFGWGLGYIGKLPNTVLFLLGICLILIQMLASKYWLSKFRFGPLEWLWRSGTYFKMQPFRKQIEK